MEVDILVPLSTLAKGATFMVNNEAYQNAATQTLVPGKIDVWHFAPGELTYLDPTLLVCPKAMKVVGA